MENQESIYEEKQGNLLTGILGALLGALIGTALWVLVGVWGYIAGIVAWLTAFLAGKGYDLLLCTEDVDEFCLQVMHEYKEKTFQNINAGDLGLETEDEKKAAEAAETENKDLFEEIKKDLNGKVKEVKVNPTLQEHPVTLTAEGGISMEMEKVLRRMPNAEGVESTKVLELNPNHTVFAALKAAHAAGDADKVAKYAELLYDQALLIAGLPIEDPVAYAQLVCGLMQ